MPQAKDFTFLPVDAKGRTFLAALYLIDYLILYSDGAAALVLVSGKKALELGLEVIALIKGYADAAQVIKLFMLLSLLLE